MKWIVNFMVALALCQRPVIAFTTRLKQLTLQAGVRSTRQSKSGCQCLEGNGEDCDAESSFLLPSRFGRSHTYPSQIWKSICVFVGIYSARENALAAYKEKNYIRNIFEFSEWDSESDTLRKSNFKRLDESPDSLFYARPRFVEHIDEKAVRSLILFHRDELTALTKNISCHGCSLADLRILDLCSSHVSHLPPEMFDQQRMTTANVTGLGMNREELIANPQLTSFVVKDLNNDPELPFTSASFDAVLLQLSIDYLVKPVAVLREAARILRPGGGIYIR